MLIASVAENNYTFTIKDSTGLVVKPITINGTNSASKQKNNSVVFAAYTDVDPSDWDAIVAQYGKHDYFLKNSVIFAEKSDAKTKEKSYDESVQAVDTGARQYNPKNLTHKTA